LVWGCRKIVRRVHNNDLQKGKPIVSDKLKETTTVGNLIGVIRTKIVHARNELAPIARICKANLVGHPKGSQRGALASQEKNRNGSMENAGRSRDDTCADLATEVLLRQVEKGMRGTQKIHT
jgi:hypothetical protein